MVDYSSLLVCLCVCVCAFLDLCNCKVVPTFQPYLQSAAELAIKKASCLITKIQCCKVGNLFIFVPHNLCQYAYYT